MEDNSYADFKSGSTKARKFKSRDPEKGDDILDAKICIIKNLPKKRKGKRNEEGSKSDRRIIKGSIETNGKSNINGFSSFNQDNNRDRTIKSSRIEDFENKPKQKNAHQLVYKNLDPSYSNKKNFNSLQLRKLNSRSSDQKNERKMASEDQYQDYMDNEISNQNCMEGQGSFQDLRIGSESRKTKNSSKKPSSKGKFNLKLKKGNMRNGSSYQSSDSKKNPHSQINFYPGRNIQEDSDEKVRKQLHNKAFKIDQNRRRVNTELEIHPENGKNMILRNQLHQNLLNKGKGIDQMMNQKRNKNMMPRNKSYFNEDMREQHRRDYFEDESLEDIHNNSLSE